VTALVRGKPTRARHALSTDAPHCPGLRGPVRRVAVRRRLGRDRIERIGRASTLQPRTRGLCETVDTRDGRFFVQGPKCIVSFFAPFF
jgi:hypothetical protein